MSNTITIELCAEDRARLDGLISVVDALLNQSNAPKQPQAAQDAPTAPETEAPKNDSPAAPEAPQGEPEPPAPAAEPEKLIVTLDDVRVLAQKLAAPNAGHREQVRAIVNEYAKSVSEIPAAKYEEVLDRLKALEVKA